MGRASELDGTIDATIVPLLVRNPLAQPDEREYSAVFLDTPQRDAGEHGPYRRAVIWERYLKNLTRGASYCCIEHSCHASATGGGRHSTYQLLPTTNCPVLAVCAIALISTRG